MMVSRACPMRVELMVLTHRNLPRVKIFSFDRVKELENSPAK